MIEFLRLVFVSLFLNMTVGLLLSFFKQNMAVVDVFWSTGIGITAWLIYFVSPPSVLLMLIVGLISLWSTRLSLFLFLTRILPGHQDRRYQKIANKWTGKKKLKTAGHFYMQASLQGLLCLCLYPAYIGLPSSVSWVTLCLVCFFILSLTGQLISDYQLESFKRSGTRGVCEKGLWSICRHPNYFFEVLMWLCLSLMTIPHAGYQIALISPLSIWIITRFITGPYTEKLSVEKRGERYKDYQNRVPMMVPSLKLVLSKIR